MDCSLGEVLYVGSETRVVRGADREGRTRVVLKLPRGEAPPARLLEKLEHEHAVLESLSVVDGVSRTLGIVRERQSIALVLEEWGDTSLGRALVRGPLPAVTTLRLGARLARVLGQVHRHGVIHRDVKPQNILVNAALSDIRLIDFGIATLRSLTVAEGTAAEALAGTLAYMAPEQTGRMARVVDARADLYALGATLYETLTGLLPFETEDPLELIPAHATRTR